MVKAYDGGTRKLSGEGAARRDAMLRRPGRSSSPLAAPTPRWVISRAGRRRGGVDLLMAHLPGGKALPIFSLKDEARAFLRASATGDWEVREAGAGELVSLLSGPCGEVERVVLDPPPEAMDEEVLGLLSVGREVFMESLLGRGRAWFEGGRFDGRRERDGR